MLHSSFKTDGKRVEWPPEAANGGPSKEEATTNGTNGHVKVSSDASSSASGLKNFVKTKLVSESNVYHNSSDMQHPSGVIKSNCLHRVSHLDSNLKSKFGYEKEVIGQRDTVGNFILTLNSFPDPIRGISSCLDKIVSCSR